MKALPGQYDLIPPYTPFLRYSVSEIDNSTDKKTYNILPNFFSRKSDFFYTYEYERQVILIEYLRVLFKS